MPITRTLQENQITRSGVATMIDSDECTAFDIHYKILVGGRIKETVYYSDQIENNQTLTLEEFIDEAEKYGSFWLAVVYNNRQMRFQIVDDETFEPI